MNYPSFIWMMLVLLGLVACKAKPEDAQQAAPAEDSVAISEEVDESVRVQMALQCLNDEDSLLICDLGLQIAPLGEPLLVLPVETFEAQDIIDSIQETTDFSWLTRTVLVADGKVVLEGDFIDNQVKELEAQLGQSRLNRLRIESPSFHTQEGIKVGDRVDRLFEAYPTEMVMTALPEFGMIDLQPVDRRLHFLIPADPEEIESDEFELPNERQIAAIVVL